MKRRAIALAAAISAALVAVGGAALAETLSGNDRDNRLTGSNRRDQIGGRDGENLIRGLGRADVLSGGEGGDTIDAGPRDESAMDIVSKGIGDDFYRVFNRPAARDVVDCVEGFDRVVADRRDLLSGCNRVSPVRRRWAGRRVDVLLLLGSQP